MTNIQTRVLRKIIKIDEEKCDGCGECIPGCPEGALQIINGKARLVSEPSCDGFGACIGRCPQGAITVEEREAMPYDERAVIDRLISAGRDVVLAHIKHLKEHNETGYLNQAYEYLKERGFNFDEGIEKPIDKKPLKTSIGIVGCPGSMPVSFSPLAETRLKSPIDSGEQTSELKHWPVQLHLINPLAAFYRNSDLLLAADCVPFAYPDFHSKFLSGRTLAIGCPKLDHNQEIYLEKIKKLILESQINSITVIIMQVPCCSGLLRLAQNAIAQSTRKVPLRLVVVGIQGKILKDDQI